MLPTRLSSSDTPPPRPPHIRSVEENIADFRRASPESVYISIQLQRSAGRPARPISRTSSVHSSDDDVEGGGGGDAAGGQGSASSGRVDNVDLSEITRDIDASILDLRSCVAVARTSSRVETEELEEQEEEEEEEEEGEQCIFRMSGASLENGSWAKLQQQQEEEEEEEEDEHEHEHEDEDEEEEEGAWRGDEDKGEQCIFRMSGASLENGSCAKLQQQQQQQQQQQEEEKATSTGTRYSEFVAQYRATACLDLAWAAHAAQEDDTSDTRFQEQDESLTPRPPPPPPKPCEWCCQPALPDAPVCALHKLKEDEEAQRERTMARQLADSTASKAAAEKQIRDKARRRRASDTPDREARRLADEIRTLEEELVSAERQIRRCEIGLGLPMPSRRAIVRAYHGKIAVRRVVHDPEGKGRGRGRGRGRGPPVVRVWKRCGCKEYRHGPGADLTYSYFQGF
ncbi:hypothetical protein E4U41_004131 [Claviceps citrina]|nr:hypothetical protein E4U41_004131 [Claviceps citrina]